MALLDFRRLYPEDYPDQQPWINKLINPINTFNEGVNSILSGITTNLFAVIKQINFTTAPDYPNVNTFRALQFQLPTAFTCSCVLVGNIQVNSGNVNIISDPVTINWVQVQPNIIQINYVTGLQANTQYILTVKAE